MEPARPARLGYFDLPANIRIAFVFICVGLFSLVLYMVMIRTGMEKGYVRLAFLTIGTGFYASTLLFLKRRSTLSYLVAMFILGPLTFFNLYKIVMLYLEDVNRLILYFWWPLIHNSIFALCFLIALTPGTWSFYRGKSV